MVFNTTFNNISVISLMVIGTGCIGSCESNYHMITTTTAPTSISGQKLRNGIVNIGYDDDNGTSHSKMITLTLYYNYYKFLPIT